MKHHPLHHRPQRGVSLLFSLLALVALTVAAVGLVRTVGTGSLVVGNVGFKMDATGAGDRGAEAAISWLRASSATTLEQDAVASGYYATSKDSLDPTGRNTGMGTRAVVDWDNNNCSGAGTFTACLDPASSTTIGGNSVSWIITRLCASTGAKDDSAQSCAASVTGSVSDNFNSGSQEYGNTIPDETRTEPYYRIVVRTVGARNTVSYTETIVHF